MLNISNLTKVNDCNTILADAGQIKSSLEWRIFSLQRQLQEHVEQSTQLPTELAAAQATLLNLEAQLTILPEGTSRHEDAIMHQNNAEKLIRSLEARVARYDAVSYLYKSRELAYAQASLDKINEVITLIQNRKTEIESAAAAA